MKHYKQIQAIGYVLLILLWFIGSQFLVGNITCWIVGKAAYETFYNTHRYSLNLISQILCLSAILAFDYKNHQFELRMEALKLKEILGSVGTGVLLYIICIGINFVLLPYFPGYKAISEMFEHDKYILSFIVIVIVAPILEEYVFRGKIQTLIKSQFTPALAILAQALLFGSLHSLALQKIYAASMGIFLGIFKERTGKLQNTIIMHMTVNFIGWLIGVLA